LFYRGASGVFGEGGERVYGVGRGYGGIDGGDAVWAVREHAGGEGVEDVAAVWAQVGGRCRGRNTSTMRWGARRGAQVGVNGSGRG
jgi:hypothetical protein